MLRCIALHAKNDFVGCINSGRSATEGTGVNDTAIGALTETSIINAGAASAGTMVAGGDIVADQFLYLVGQGTGHAAYTAGRFLIEITGFDIAS